MSQNLTGFYFRPFSSFVYIFQKSLCLFFSACILIFCNQAGYGQSLIWAKGFGNPDRIGGNIYGTGIKTDASGNTYVTGYYYASADMDPGTATANLTSTGSADIFIAKYDAAGNYVWAKSIGGSGDDDSSRIALDASGNIYITGYFHGTADFDPAAATANLTSTGSADIFIAKYDASGNYLWAKNIGGTGDDIPAAIAITGSSNIYVTGTFTGTADFDAGAATANLTSNGGADIFLTEYDGSGNYLWAKSIGGSTNDNAFAFAFDNGNDICLTGSFAGTVDFDANAGTANLTSAGGTDIFIAKYDASGSYMWAKNIGDTGDDAGRGIATDASGNIYITGSFSGTVDFDLGAGTANQTSAGGTDIFFGQYNSSGVYQWALSIGDVHDDAGRNIITDGLGNVYITASFLSYFSATSDAFVFEFTTDGTFILTTGYGGSDNDDAQSIATDGSGNIYLTGYFTGSVNFGSVSLNAPVANAVVAKYNSSGNTVWAGQLGRYALSYSSNTIVTQSMVRDAHGNIYLTGYFNGTVDFNNGPGIDTLNSGGSNTAFFVKYDANGNYIWAKRISGRTISMTVDGSNVYIAGLSVVNDGFITRYDTSGNFAWIKSLTGSSCIPIRVTTDATGNVYVTGQFRNTVDFDPGAGTANLASNGFGDAFFAKYDASGNYLWAKSIGSTADEGGLGITTDASGNVYISGSFQFSADFDPGAGIATLTSAGGQDIYLAKYNASGNYIWARNMGGLSSEFGRDLRYNNGYLYVTGDFSSTADFDPGAGTATLTSAGGSDIYLAKYDDSGNYIWAKNMGGTGNDVGYAVAFDNNGNVYITGDFSGTANFNGGAANAKLTSAGASDVFFAKYDAAGNYIVAKNVGGTGYDGCNAILSDGGSNIYVAGFFSKAGDFDPDATVYTLTSLNDATYDLFIGEYNLIATPLPVTLLNFEAKPQQSKWVHVNWTITEQLNNNYFEVQRSTNGIQFETIGKINGCTCDATMKYEFDDLHPYTGTSYYRLKQVDIDGRSSYSKMAIVAFSNQLVTDISIFPNPGVGRFVLQLQNSASSRQVVIEITNASGSTIRQFNKLLSSGENLMPVDLTTQPAGLYFIRINNNDGKEATVLKVIKN